MAAPAELSDSLVSSDDDVIFTSVESPDDVTLTSQSSDSGVDVRPVLRDFTFNVCRILSGHMNSGKNFYRLQNYKKKKRKDKKGNITFVQGFKVI